MSGLFRLIRTELLRGGGWFVLVIAVIAAYMTDLRFLLWDEGRRGAGRPTWYSITAVGYAITGLYPFVAAYGAWLGSRPGRSHVAEMEGRPRRFIIGSSGPRIISMAIWTVAAALLIYFAVAIATWRRAADTSGTSPFGAVPWQGPIVIVIALVAFALWGYLLGVLVPRLFAPLLAAGAIYLIFQIPLTFSNWWWSRQIIPYDVAATMAPYIDDAVYPRLLAAGSAWFLLLAILPIAILAVRARVTIGRWGMLITIVLAATVAGWQVGAAAERAPQWHADHRGQDCVTIDSIDFCAPPATLGKADLKQNAQLLLALFPDWFPRSVLPDRFSLAHVDRGNLPAGSAPMVDIVRSPRRQYAEVQALMALLSQQVATNGEVPTATQATIACVLFQSNGNACNPVIPDPQLQNVPDAGNTQEARTIFAPLQGKQLSDADRARVGQAVADLQAQMNAKAKAFSALPDSQKRAWLEENWDALHSGALGLDELPG